MISVEESNKSNLFQPQAKIEIVNIKKVVLHFTNVSRHNKLKIF